MALRVTLTKLDAVRSLKKTPDTGIGWLTVSCRSESWKARLEENLRHRDCWHHEMFVRLSKRWFLLGWCAWTRQEATPVAKKSASEKQESENPPASGRKDNIHGISSSLIGEIERVGGYFEQSFDYVMEWRKRMAAQEKTRRLAAVTLPRSNTTLSGCQPFDVFRTIAAVVIL
jgi:hypothetical protein